MPVSLAAAKAHLRVDGDDNDASIAGMIAAAVGILDGREGVLGRCLEPQTWELTLDRFPANEVWLPLGPVASVVSVNYIAPGGMEVAVSGADYEVDNAPTFEAWLMPSTPWPALMTTINALKVRFIAGTGTPAAIRQAILEMVSVKYDDRQGGPMLTLGVLNDIAPFRRTRL